MKHILCFGDSNTWGFNPLDGSRFSFEVRWTGVLQRELGTAVRVIEEGLNGRTTSWDDPIWDGRNGRKILPILLETHSPLDLVVIMLGTNDVKVRFQLTPYSIAQGAAALVQLCRSATPCPEVILVSPAHVVESTDDENTLAFAGSIEKSKQLAGHFQAVARQTSCHFLDAAEHARSSTLDGIHWEEESHQRFGKTIAAAIQGALGERLREGRA